jgi:hypothetical protein
MSDPLEHDHIGVEVENLFRVRVPVTAPVAGDLQTDVPLVRRAEINVVPLPLEFLGRPDEAKSTTP